MPNLRISAVIVFLSLNALWLKEGKIYVYVPHYFEFKKPSNLRRTPLLKTDSQKKKIANKDISLSVNFTTLLARPLVLREKLCFRDFRRVKNITPKCYTHPNSWFVKT